MIVLRFGLWRRLWYGKYEYRRVYIGKLPLPFCIRRPRQDQAQRVRIPMDRVKLFGMYADKYWEKRKDERKAQ